MLNALMVMLSIVLILSVVGWVVGGVPFMILFGFIALLLDATLYILSTGIVLRSLKAKPFDDPVISSMVENLALDCQIKKPGLMIIESDLPNALCVGRHKNKGVVVITRGLLELPREEVRSMIGLVMGLMRNRNIPSATVGAAVGAFFSWPANRGYWHLFSVGGERRQGNMFSMIPILIFAPIGALFVKLSVERGMYERGDYTSVMLKNHPKHLASALRKATFAVRGGLYPGPVYTANLFAAKPFKGDWFTDLFDCHPYIERRIEILEGLRLGK